MESFNNSDLKEKSWTAYTLKHIKKININSIPHIVNWCKKNWILVKDFYDLNPWVLTNTLPEWSWQISVYK
jgi:hypothetical protein